MANALAEQTASETEKKRVDEATAAEAKARLVIAAKSPASTGSLANDAALAKAYDEAKQKAEAEKDIYSSIEARRLETVRTDSIREQVPPIIMRATAPRFPSSVNHGLALTLSLAAGIVLGSLAATFDAARSGRR